MNIERYYLGSAQVAKEVPFPGDGLMIWRASTPAAFVDVRWQRARMNIERMALGAQVRKSHFDSFWLEWAAQPGEWVELAVTTGDEAKAAPYHDAVAPAIVGGAYSTIFCQHYAHAGAVGSDSANLATVAAGNVLYVDKLQLYSNAAGNDSTEGELRLYAPGHVLKATWEINATVDGGGTVPPHRFVIPAGYYFRLYTGGAVSYMFHAVIMGRLEAAQPTPIP